jgi:hypothetical protein
MLITDALTALKGKMDTLQTDYNAVRDTLTKEQSAIHKSYDQRIKEHNEERDALIAVDRAKVAKIVGRINARPKDPTFFYYLQNNIDLELLYGSLTAPTDGQMVVSMRTLHSKDRWSSLYPVLQTFIMRRHSRHKRFIWKKDETFLNKPRYSVTDGLIGGIDLASEYGVPMVFGARGNKPVELPTLLDAVIVVRKSDVEDHWRRSWRFREFQREQEYRRKEEGKIMHASREVLIVSREVAVALYNAKQIENPGIETGE